MTGRALGREPVMTVSTAVALLIAILPAFNLPATTVGAVSAALVVLGGAVSAALVSVDRLLPLLVGVAKAVVAAVATFGVHIPDNWIAALMAVLTVVAGLATRAQVGAVQPPVDRQGRQVFVSGTVQTLDATPADASEAPVIRRGEFVTEQMPAVVSDSEQKHAHEKPHRQPRHAVREGLGRVLGDLGPI